MTDIQTCLAAFVVASGTGGSSEVGSVDRTIEVFLADKPEHRVEALLTLKAAFVAMTLDGHVATYISSRIDANLAMHREMAGVEAPFDGRLTQVDVSNERP